MKKNLIISSLLVAVSLSFVACDKKSETNQSSKIEINDKSNLNLVSGKPNIIFLTREHCGSCEEMKKTLKTKEISAILESKFNIIFLDINNVSLLPKGLSEPIGTPTLYFIDAAGVQLVEPLIGATDENSFISILQSAISEYSAKYPSAK